MKIHFLFCVLSLAILNTSCSKCDLLEQTITDPLIPCEGTFYINNVKDEGGSEFYFFFNQFSKPYLDPFIRIEIEGPQAVLVPLSTIESNFSAFDELNNRYIFQYIGIDNNSIPRGFLYMHDFQSNTSSFVNTRMFSAPVFLLGRLYCVQRLGGFEVIQIDPNSGLEVGKVALLNFTPKSPFDLYGISSATDGIDHLYFLSGTNLIVVEVSTKTYKYFDVDLAFDATNNPVNYLGLEYKKDEGLLIAMKNLKDASQNSITDIVSINPSSFNPIAKQRVELHNYLPASQDKVINSDFYSTTFDNCDNTYYITEIQRFNNPLTSTLIQVKLDSYKVKIIDLTGFQYGIEFRSN